MWDLQAPRDGDLTDRLLDYSAEANRRLVAATLRPIAKRLPPGSEERLASLPALFPCTTAPSR